MKTIPTTARSLPRPLVARLLLGGEGVWGWAFAAFGVVIALVFVPDAMPDFASYDVTAFGTVQRVERTNMDEGKRDIWRVTYTFEDPTGQLRHGQSYTTDPVEPNSEHMVEYTRGDPNVSRLRGMRRNPFPPLAAFIALMFPLIGLVTAGRQLVRGVRAVRLLRTGVETTGKIVDIAQIKPGRKKRSPTMRATVEFLAGERTSRTTFDFSQADAPTRDGVQRLVYDPQRPTRTTMLDNLPGQPRITEDGVLASTSGSAVLVFIAPVVFVLELAAIPLVF